MMGRFKIYFIPLTFLLASFACAVDRTRENGASGSAVVEAVVDLLRARCILSDDNFFLRRMAYATSNDGKDSDTYRVGFDGGIWQITKQQLRITQTSNLLARQRIGVNGNFSIPWTRVTWSDLRKPLYSGIAAALYLRYVVDYHRTAIPNSINEQGQFWVDRFNGKMDDFLAVMNLKEVSCDMKPVDLVFVVDESGSIGQSNFIRMKNFLRELVDQITISNTAFNVGLVKFHKRTTTEFPLDKYSHKSSVKAAIQSMAYFGGGTNIGAGINTAREVFKDSNRKDATKVIILLTDGRSSSKTETAQEAQLAQAEGINIFVIGIGNVDPDEITSAASQPTCVHVFLLQGFSSIDNILYEVRRRSCKAPTKVEIVNQKETKVEGELSPDQVVEDTVEIDSAAPATTITTEVNCGEVELFASANTTSPSEALYEARGLARDNQPALFSIQNGGRTVYVYYKGKIISTTNDCKNLQKTFSISFTQASDFCKNSPCENGATCVDQASDFTCRCPSGYEGKRCEKNTDECRNNPCVNGGRCENIENGYKCVCVAGFTGNTCEIKVDQCANSPCQNGGSCSNVNNDFVCTCRQGFSGKTCTVDVDECQPSPCLNGGVCRDLVNDFSCQCKSGFSGKTCDVNTDDCSPNPCQNGGSCLDLVNDFRCTCSNGYTGKTCDVIIDHCKGSPCRNAGRCVNSADGYSCVCQSGFAGKNCENVTTVLMCRVGSVTRECTAEDIQGSGLASQICTKPQVLAQNTPTTTPNPGTGNSASSVCVPKGFIYHIPYPQDKSKFIQCDEYGKSTVMPCSPGTEFNAQRQVCTGNGICPSTAYVKLPHPTNPGEYYECVHGVSYQRHCPGNLVFDGIMKYCTWPTSKRQLNGDNDVGKDGQMGEDKTDRRDNSFEDQVKRLGERNVNDEVPDGNDKQMKLEKLRALLQKYLGQ